MSQGCNNTLSSNVKVSIIPNTDCSASPTLHQVVTTVAAVPGDTRLTLRLDPTFTPSSGAYTAASKYALTPGNILVVGGIQVEVAEPTDGSGVYFITTTAQAINVVFLKVAVPVGAAATTYFAISLCLKKADITTNTTAIDNTTNCTGVLFTQINVGYMKMLDMAGFLTSKEYGYYLLKLLGKDLQSAFFAIDYDRRFFNRGVVQLTDPSITEAVVKQIAGWSIQGQIQSVDASYDSYLTTLQKASLDIDRASYGFKVAQGIVII